MSFSQNVKEEMARHLSPARHCQLAELAAMMHFCGQYGRDSKGLYTIGFQTENEAVSRKGFTLLKKTYNIEEVKVDFNKEIENLKDKLKTLDSLNVFKKSLQEPTGNIPNLTFLYPIMPLRTSKQVPSPPQANTFIT